MLLNDCVLPNAKRDTSAEFKKVLAEDADVQKVLQQNTPKLQEWLRPILRRERSAATPNPKMTYKLWVSLMDGPSPAEMAAAAREGKKNPKPACPKQVGNWEIMQESQITGDERTGRKSVLRFKASLSIPQCRWNFLRSQTVEQVESDEVE